MKGNLIIVSSPSGGGKGTLIKEVLKVLPNIGYSISFTTREIRGREENGRDYFFVGKAQFEELIKKGEFLEFAEVHGNFYGTSMSFVKAEIDSGRDVVLEIDVQGADSVRKTFPEAVSIFILPPSFEVLRKRLTARATEKKADLNLRLKNSFREVERFEEFEYIVINNEVTKATIDLKTIILAERLKRIRQSGSIKAILDSFNASSVEKYIAGD
ncbi:MAG: guanylate kinase [Pyrinomonadaceae bacterium]